MPPPRAAKARRCSLLDQIDNVEGHSCAYSGRHQSAPSRRDPPRSFVYRDGGSSEPYRPPNGWRDDPRASDGGRPPEPPVCTPSVHSRAPGMHSLSPPVPRSPATPSVTSNTAHIPHIPLTDSQHTSPRPLPDNHQPLRLKPLPCSEVQSLELSTAVGGRCITRSTHPQQPPAA